MISQNIDLVREYMKKVGVDAVVIPTADPHQNEYVADAYRLRAHLSGFTGSAGVLVVGEDWAGLWTDGRYELQATQQLKGTGIDLYCTVRENTPGIEKKLAAYPEDAVILVDGSRISYKDYEKMKEEITPRRIRLDMDSGALWLDAPGLPDAPVVLVSDENAGLSVGDKLALIREKLKEGNVSGSMIGASEDVAWILNLRGRDVSHTPVFYAFLWVDMDQVILFIDENKVPVRIREKLATDGVRIAPYRNAYTWMNPTEQGSVLLDPLRTNTTMALHFTGHCEVVFRRNPSTDLKAVKNETEIRNLREAYRKDGIALTKFFYWLHSEGIGKTEWEISERLKAFRAEGVGFLEPSFTTIAGYGENAAIIHYSPDERTSTVLQPKGLLLVDSGGQYEEGTTDITRTVALGDISETEKRDYTLTLQSHIALARAVFAKGVTGTVLDGLARYPMWQQLIDYRHGTGHGVGYRLSVHEGPMSISRPWNDVALIPGMVVSIEPGIYREGSHGVRIENIAAVEEAGANDFGEFYEFSLLSDCYIDTDPLDLALLSAQEKEWLNAYNQRVYENLSSGLEGDVLGFLRRKTRAVY